MSNDLRNEPQMPAELAPSETRSEAPYITRVLGGCGLFLFVVGGASALAASGAFGSVVVDPINNISQPRGLLGLGTSYLMTLIALAFMFVHAVGDTDVEIRRLYGGFAALLLFAAVVVSLVPYPVKEFTKFNNLMPWGVLLALLGLLFSVPFLRNETDEKLRDIGSKVMLGFGVSLSLIAIVTGLLTPNFLIGPGFALGLLGLGFLVAYFNQNDVSDGLPFFVCMGLGILGAIALAFAIGRTFAPTILFEGPNALKLPTQEYDKWKVAGRVFLVLVSLSLVAWSVLGRMAPWLRGVVGVLGLSLAAVFLIGSFSAPLTIAPPTYLVPYGVILGFLGVLYLGISLTTTSDEPFLVLFRREMAAYFFSPIAYIVLFSAGIVTAMGYYWFLNIIGIAGAEIPQPVQEPVISRYTSLGIIGAFMTVFMVPAITMRLLSEEQRTGTMEVLLTAPVNEPVIVLSKFCASWLFFMLCWLPAGLYLVGLQSLSTEESRFDYRPMLTFYLCAACNGAAFVALGLFFSSLTRNQIVAAVMTFAAMIFMLLTVLIEDFRDIPGGLQAVLKRFNFLGLWQESLAGQLQVQVIVFQLSVAGFWLFVTTKILEARKWS
jgi:ABC-2 type transport system permease protein